LGVDPRVRNGAEESALGIAEELGLVKVAERLRASPAD
jgi:hypothetical protein